MPVTVELEKAHGGGEDPCYFVMVKGVPYSKGLVITNAVPIEFAERIKAAVEEALGLYRAPKPPKKPRAPKNRFQRL